MKLDVLIVDDEIHIRKTLAYCLTGEGHRTISVSNAEDALVEARHRHFDLVFLDLRLGDQDGMDTTGPGEGESIGFTGP